MSKSLIVCSSIILALNLTSCASMSMDEIVEDYEQKKMYCEDKQPLYNIEEVGKDEITGKPNLVRVPVGAFQECFGVSKVDRGLK